MAFWTYHETARLAEHVHDLDEYMVVAEGGYTIIIQGRRIILKAGQEYFIPKGTPQGRRGHGGK
jgi:mannose-6-phosphate isomerase-like protein (cupin superfamily)